MRGRNLVLLVVTIGLAVVVFVSRDWAAPEHLSSLTTQRASSQGSANSKSGPEVYGVPILSGIDAERKRRILNAAVACKRADYFREAATRAARTTSGNPSDSLSEVQLRNFEQAQRQCSTDPAARTAPVNEFLADLARNGNMAAAACYASGGIRSGRHGVPPPDDANYRKLVPVLIDRGVAAGDWQMVSLAAAINGARMAGSPFTYMPPPKPELEYLYVKLLELGAQAEEKVDLQAVLTQLAKKLSPSEITAAELRAESLFLAHFSQSPPYRHGSQPLCADF